MCAALDGRGAAESGSPARSQPALRASSRGSNGTPASEPVPSAAAMPRNSRSKAQAQAAKQTELTNYFRSLDPQLANLVKIVADHPKPADKRLVGVQDLTWALLNSPEFLFNH